MRVTVRRKRIASSVFIVFCFCILYVWMHTKNTLIERRTNYNWFIAACLYDNSNILDNWTQQLLLLIDELTPDNVFVSIMENGDSTDNTLTQLNAFKIKLDQANIQNTIITKHVINRPPARFEYLSAIRNEALKPLFNLSWNSDNTKIIFFNDIYYKLSDIINLINTNNMEYDLACGLDFYYAFYDTLVTRDSNGKGLMDYYPYFQNSINQKLVKYGLPVRVYCGWNGMVVMNAIPFMKYNVRFRQFEAGENDESECYFICKDFWKLGFDRIYINPNVKVAYTPMFYYLHKYFMRPVNIFTDWYYWLTKS
ncbi:hypothetical protein I4U23_023375 [Adineta vaga]|nr:hypothetical protein I4U23_023375 [Adineta vaga]